VFVAGIALPLIYREFAMSPAETGLVSAAPLAGILIGATTLGAAADRFGRKPVFIAEMAVLIVLLAGLMTAASLPVVLLCLLGIGVALAALSAAFVGTAQIVLIFIGFMMFNFMTNLGRSAQTYLIAAEVFPTALRGRGAGLAASIGKIGAVSTAFLMPVLLLDIGRGAVLALLVITSLAEAFLTWRFRIDTCGTDLEAIQPKDDFHTL
jgi:MFS transporter, putative metabolite transport protein